MKNLIIASILIFLVGCQSTSDTADTERGYTVLYDKFKDVSFYSIVPAGELDGSSMFKQSQMFIDMYRSENDNQPSTTMAIILRLEDWAFIDPGDSLIMIVDGERLTFGSANGSSDNRELLKGLLAIGSLKVREAAYYPIAMDQIKRLAYSTKVDVAVYGSNQTIVRSFSSDHIASIRNYYEKFLIPNEIQ